VAIATWGLCKVEGKVEEGRRRRRRKVSFDVCFLPLSFELTGRRTILLTVSIVFLLPESSALHTSEDHPPAAEGSRPLVKE